MSQNNDTQFMIAVKNIGAGSVGGFLQGIVGHPFDTLKVKLQTTTKYSGVVDCFKSVVKEEGLSGLYRGVQSPLVGLSAINAVAFFAFGEAKEIVRDKNERVQDLSIAKISMAGAMAGAVLALIEGPVDFYKCQLQMRPTEYKGLIDAVGKISRNYGIRGAFQGFTPTLIRNVPANLAYFAVYEYSKKLLAGDKQPTYADFIIAGGFAGLGYWGSCYPVDVIKSKMQTDTPVKAERKYVTTLQTAKLIYRDAGFGGFFKGVAPCMLRAFPANAACFVGFEFARSMFNK
jgi:solute carrier family 25 carnitine/acylcarnitine transporter 20/29